VRKTFTEREVRFVIHGLRSGPGQFSKRWGTFDPSVWSRCGNESGSPCAPEQQLEDRRFLVHSQLQSRLHLFRPAHHHLDRLGVQLRRLRQPTSVD